MPMFEYYCPRCQKIVERLIHNADQSDSQYHECGNRLQKRTSVSSFTIKGFSEKNGYSARGRA